MMKGSVRKDRLRQELPLVLFDKHFGPSVELLQIVLLEHTQVAIDTVFIIDPLFLSHSTGQFVLPYQQRHDASFIVDSESVRYLTDLLWVKMRRTVRTGMAIR